MKLVGLQLKLLKDRIAELRQQKRLQRERRALGRWTQTVNGRDARARRAFALRMARGLTFKKLGEALGVSAGRAREWFQKGNFYHTRRKHVPAFHLLEGDNWVAYNCRREGNWFGRCERPALHSHVVSRMIHGELYL